MKLHKLPAILLSLALCLSLTGCAGIFEHDYLVITDHLDDYVDIRNDDSVQNVRNYISMKNALLNLVNSASEAGVITTKNYSGNVKDDISKACLEVTRETPMGVFAVDYMTHDATQILSYYEIDVYINYKRSKEEINSVVTVNSGPALQELLKGALQSYSPNVSALMVSTSITEEDITSYVLEFYRLNPIVLPELPALTISAYPSIDAVQKIISIDFDYTMSIADLRALDTDLRVAARDFVSGMDGMDSIHSALELCRRMERNCQTSASGSLATDVLIGGVGNAEGFAMAFKLLCDLVNVECTVVEGRMDGEAHFWNIIRLGSDFYHVDPYMFDAEGPAFAFLMDDSGMLGRYWWDTEKYEACSGTLRYETIVGTQEPVSPSPAPLEPENSVR